MASPASLRMLPQTPSPMASLQQFLITMEQVRRMRVARAHQESGGSPLKALIIISENTDVLSPNILKASRRAVRDCTSSSRPGRMSQTEGRVVLREVASAVACRVKRRREGVAAMEAAAVEEARMQLGAERREFRARVALRPVKIHRAVDNALRIHIN